MVKGETDLEALLRNMSPELDARVFVFAHIPTGSQIQDNVTQSAIMTFEEDEGLTLILEDTFADSLGLAYDFRCRKITLNIHSSLEAVGFLARIIPELARRGMGVNPVAGYFHDHLFIPEAFADKAMKTLQNLTLIGTQ